MSDNNSRRSGLHINLDERKLSVIFFSLFSSWLLAFPFEGQILYSITDYYCVSAYRYVFIVIAAIFTGLFSGGFIARNRKTAKNLILITIIVSMIASGVFFFPPSYLWIAALLPAAFFAGCCIAAWGFFVKSSTPKNERIKTMADMLIISNILMILFNIAAIHISPQTGLGLSILSLFAAFLLALKLPAGNVEPVNKENSIGIVKPLAFLCLFIVVITVNSGLMYQVMGPAFAHLGWLTSWYWAIPYIIAIYIMRNLPRKTNRTYMLYVAIAMIGLSFIGFITLDRSAAGYFTVNSLMMGACGVYDLFWWSILGEMLDFHKNPAWILGTGLSANVLGVLLGGMIGNAFISADMYSPHPTLLALAVVCVTLILLPPLHKRLSSLMEDHVYLTVFSRISAHGKESQIDDTTEFENLSKRESQVASRLLQGKTYRAIAGELYISENTVKYYVKNIYSKFNIQSRMELIEIMLDKGKGAPL